MLGEARDLAEEMGDVEGQAEATQWRVSALMALGEIVPAREELAVALDMAQNTRQPFILHVAEHYRSALALLEGHLAEAEAAAERSREWGQLLVGRDASGVYGIQMFGVRREQGRLAELAPVIRVLAAGDRGGGAWRPGLAAMLAELAMEEQVRGELDRVQAEGLEPLREGLWLASLTYLADAAGAIAHEEVASLVYPLLAPLAGTNVMIGHGVACYGAADRYLGMLAATLGEDDRAAEPLRGGPPAQQADGRGHVARPYRLRVRTHAARPGEIPIAGNSCSPRPRSSPRPWGCPRCSRVSAPSRPHRSRRCRTASPHASSTCFAWWLVVAPTVRSGPRCSSASTPPLTTSAASCARPLARTAPRRRLTPIDAAWPRAERRRSIQHMPMYVIERAFAEQLDLTSDDVKLIEEVNADEGVRWLFSFLSADRRRSYCLYEAPSPDMIVAAAKRVGIPADAVVEVNRISADMYV